MCVPDQVEVVARHKEHVGSNALEVEELFVSRYGVLQELVAAIMWQRHLHARHIRRLAVTDVDYDPILEAKVRTED